MSDFNVDDCFEIALKAVKEGGEVCYFCWNSIAFLKGSLWDIRCRQVIRKAFREKKSISVKSCDVDLVTETDQAVEKLLMTRIHESFPSHK